MCGQGRRIRSSGPLERRFDDLVSRHNQCGGALALMTTSPTTRNETEASLTIIGGGLAGTEAAWQAAQRRLHVRLVEMRPVRKTPAHGTDRLAELVCSNSLGSDLPDRASGMLKAEMRRFGSLILEAAEASAVPAGGALAVGREAFAQYVTEAIEAHPRIEVIREEAVEIPEGPCIIATGPLTSDALAQKLALLTGQEHLYFYDALAPIVTLESIDFSLAFRQSRYDRGERDDGDYINCPMDKAQYEAFVEALLAAERIPMRDFENEDSRFFEGCMPVEVLAARGPDSLAFGPMRPVGLTDPHLERRPHAVVQLRQDNVADTLYNLVGFQTNLRWGQQEAVLRMIPGLADAEFVRLGQMHRNTFLNAPLLLEPSLAFKQREDLFFAGQITGIEGYTGNAASGLLAGLNALLQIRGEEPFLFPRTSMLGALCHYITACEPKRFQPMKANFGIIPPLDKRVKKKIERYQSYSARGLADLDEAMMARQLGRVAPAAAAAQPEAMGIRV
jgi:methylenetetrahydrofolate--tRNA-(uracil-5-)-methyltransferase